MADDLALLAEQRAFYRRRAPEYDEWWQRRGRYDHGPDEAEQWEAEVREVEAALASFDATGDVLELAGGTGWWTERLARTAGRLTVVDSSPEAIELNSGRILDAGVGDARVEYVTADIFSWEPPRPGAYDRVFFSFWLSHVPRARFEEFWGLVGRCLANGGGVFVLDNRRDQTVTVPDPYVLEESGDVQLRRLGDGSEHRVVKIFYEPGALEERLSEIGWAASIRGTKRFVYGTARRVGDRHSPPQ